MHEEDWMSERVCLALWILTLYKLCLLLLLMEGVHLGLLICYLFFLNPSRSSFKALALALHQID